MSSKTPSDFPQLEESDQTRVAQHRADAERLNNNCDFILNFETKEPDITAKVFNDAVANYLRLRFPKISILSPAGQVAGAVPRTELKASEQKYCYLGEIEEIFVGAGSGQAATWNDAVRRSTGEILLFLSANIQPDAGMLTRHADQIVIGKMDLVVAADQELEEASALYRLFDSPHVQFSVKRSVLSDNAFDPAFETSTPTPEVSAPFAPFALVDFGFRLYRSGARIGTDSIDNRPVGGPADQASNTAVLDNKPPTGVGSPEQLRRLLALYPELPIVCRRWFERIAAESGLDTEKIDGLSCSRRIRTIKSRVKILSYRWW